MSFKSYLKKKNTLKSGKRKNIDEMNFHELIKVCDREFSLYVRMNAAEENGLVKCCTCERIKKWNEGIDLGHYINRHYYAVRFDERNTGPQCKWCNSFREGEKHLFKKYLVEKYGDWEIGKMELIAHETKTINKEWLIYHINFYRKKNKELKEKFL